MFDAAPAKAGLRWLATLFAAVSFAIAAPAAAQESELARIVQDYETFDRREDPITAGQEGDRAALGRLPEVTPAANARRAAALEQFRARLAAVRADDLSAEARLNRDYLARTVSERLEGIGFDRDRLTAVDHEGGPSSTLSYLADVTPVRDRADAEAWIARMGEAPRLYREIIANGRRGLQTGWVQPRPVVESGLAVLKAEASLAPDADPLLKPLRNLPASIPASEQSDLRRRALAVLTEQVLPARREYLAFVETEVLPRARPELGVGSLPQGERYYAYLARYHTTTALTPGQIHALGQDEVRRIRARMDQVMAETGFKGDFPAFLAFLRSDPQFYARTREDLLEKASEIAKRADYGLPRIFGTLPRLPYGVIPTPRELEANTTTGRYYPGSPKTGVAGGYLVNTGQLEQRPLYELPALTLHEAVPGHHLQIALAQELEGLPYFRRNAQATAFVEGWGLYAEHLGGEMGIYRTPYERFGQLSYEMWRACRLVADTGLHVMGWSREQARACFRDNSALSEKNIETELDRYIADPGQALAYKLGELRFKALRAKAEQRLGARFDVRRFHDAVLLKGPLPLEVLEAEVDRWLATEAARAQ
jgi:uncharacterized protein (DUF885 family)